MTMKPDQCQDVKDEECLNECRGETVIPCEYYKLLALMKNTEEE